MEIYLLMQKSSQSMGHGEGSWPFLTFAGAFSYEQKEHPAFTSVQSAKAYSKENIPSYIDVVIKEVELQD